MSDTKLHFGNRRHSFLSPLTYKVHPWVTCVEAFKFMTIVHREKLETCNTNVSKKEKSLSLHIYTKVGVHMVYKSSQWENIQYPKELFT